MSEKNAIVKIGRYTPFQVQDYFEPNGFPNRTDTTISWTDTSPDRTFSLTGTNFKVYIQGHEYIKSTETVQIVNTPGLYWIYYSATGVLTASTTFPGFDLPTVATVYWNGTYGRRGDERHGLTMDASTHQWAHETIGARWDILHGGLSGTFGNTSFTITEGSFYDEDLEISISQQTQCRILYRASGNFSWTAKQNEYYYSSGGNIYYDNAGTITAATSNYFVAYWVFATADPETPIWVLMGQRQDNLLPSARANNTFDSLSLGTLPFVEMKLLYRVIVKNDATPYEETLDYRNIQAVPSGNYVATNHSTLTNLTGTDDHTQYALLAGRGASQTIYGAENSTTGSGGYLSLQSTAYSTKGYVDLEGVYHVTRPVQTTDATVTDIYTIAVAEGDLWEVTADILGQQSDNSNRALYHLVGLFYRNSGGNVTQQGDTYTLPTIESDTDWDANLVADTGNQTIDIKVTGKISTTINWKASVKYFKRG